MNRRAVCFALAGLTACSSSETCPRGSHRLSDPAPDGSTQRQVGCQTDDGVRVGPSEMFFDSQRTAQGSYAQGERQGTWSFWSPNGELIERLTYDAGKLGHIDFQLPACPAGSQANGSTPPAGEAVWCQHKNAAGEWVNHGSFASWYDNGEILARGRYDEGVQAGPFEMWYPNGQLKGRGTLADGRAEGPWTSWHDNGFKHIVATFKRGEEEGPWVSYWEEGSKSAEGQFVHGWEDGAWTFWHPNGRLSQQGGYHEGKRTGWWRSWDVDGNDDGMVEYQDGVEVSTAAAPVGP